MRTASVTIHTSGGSDLPGLKQITGNVSNFASEDGIGLLFATLQRLIEGIEMQNKQAKRMLIEGCEELGLWEGVAARSVSRPRSI